MVPWNSDYETGVEPIDAHHREVFEFVSMLDQVIGSTDPEKDMAKIIGFIDHYVQHHFPEEEAYMAKHHYAALEHHQLEHEILTYKVKELIQYHQLSGSLTHTIFLVRKFIDKLVQHILNVDVKLKEIEHGGPA